jgi:homoprotocatechuate degradation regulator HpaR
MSELRDFQRSLPMALMRARETVMQQFRPSLSAHDISEQQWRVLRALTEDGRPKSVGELVELTFLLGPSLSRMLVALEERGLIERSTDASDGRRVAIVATRRGFELVDTIAPISEARYDWIEQRLGAGDLEQLYALLERVADLSSDAAADG